MVGRGVGGESKGGTPLFFSCGTFTNTPARRTQGGEGGEGGERAGGEEEEGEEEGKMKEEGKGEREKKAKGRPMEEPLMK